MRGTVQTPTSATKPLTTTFRSLRRARPFTPRESGPRSSSRSCHAAFCLPLDALCGRHMRLLFANHVFWMTHDTLKYLVAILAATALAHLSSSPNPVLWVIDAHFCRGSSALSPSLVCALDIIRSLRFSSRFVSCPTDRRGQLGSNFLHNVSSREFASALCFGRYIAWLFRHTAELEGQLINNF